MEKNEKMSLLRSKNLWLWVGVGALAVVALAGALLLLPTVGGLSVTPTLVNAQGEVEPDTAFAVTTPKSMTEKELRETLVLWQEAPAEPGQQQKKDEVNYRLEPQQAGGYLLTPLRPLAVGGRLSVKNGNQSTGYPVAKTLLVTSFMPMNGSANVPVHSGVEFQFNQKGLSLADFKAALTISPEIVGEVTGGDGRFVIYPREAMAYGATYTVTLNPPLATPSGVALREATTFTFTTITSLAEATDYLFSLSQPGATYNVLADEAPQMMVYLDGRITQPEPPRIGVKLYKYPTADDYNKQVELNSTSPSYGKGSAIVQLDVTGLTQHSAFETTPFVAMENTGGKGGGSNQFVISFPAAIPVGQYAVEYSLTTDEKGSDGQPYVIKRYQLLQSTDLSVFFMQTGDDLLLWVNDITTGQPVEGAQFELSGDLYASAVTGPDGTALVRRPDMAVEDWQYNQGVFTLTAGDRVFIDSQVFNPDGANPNADYISYLFTDRPIYRTTDTIKVWGMVRPRNSAVEMPEEYTISFSAGDSIRVKPDAKGLFTAEIAYSGINMGWGSVRLLGKDDNALSSVDFPIEDYTKPVYTVSSAPTQPVYLLAQGEKPIVNIDVSLYDGTPVPAFAGQVESWNSGVEFAWAGEALRTGATGRATVQMKIGDSPDSWYPSDYQYRYSNADPENQNLYEYGYVFAIHRDLMLTGEPTFKDGKAEVAINTNRIDTSRVKESSDLWKPNILKGANLSTAVTATLTRHYYDKVNRGTTYDFITRTAIPSYEYIPKEEVVQVYELTTKNGSYTLKDIPCPVKEGDSYTLELVAPDSTGATVRYTVGLTPYDESWWRGNEGYRYSLSKQLQSQELKLIQDSTGSRYELQWEKRFTFVDDEAVTFALQRNEKPVEQMTGKLLTATVQKGFENLSITDKSTVTLPYSEALLPNYVMTGAYFDGRHTFILQDSYMNFNPEKRELEVKLTGDKKEYAPKDPVKLDATVTNKSTGKPATNAELVVAVVDESIFAMQEQNSDLLRAIYGSVHYPQISKYSSYTPLEYGGGGEKGGGGGETLRSDFKDTAYFATAKTDQNGKAQFSFTMPDNITSWRATGLALTDDNQAGNTTTQLVATQKFYITPVINETLLAGDSFAVGLRGAGKAVNETSEVSYTVQVKGDSYDQTLTTTAKLRDYATVVFDPPAPGEYTVTIRASSGSGNTDAVRLPFTVIPSGVERTVVKTVNLADGIAVTPLRYPVRIELYNQSMRSYNRVLQNLINTSGGVRADMRVARKYTAQVMEQEGGYWYYGSAQQDITDLTQGDLLSVLPYTQKDIDLTAQLLLAVPQMINLSMPHYSEEEILSMGTGSVTSFYLAQAVRGTITAEQVKTKLLTGVNYTLVEQLNLTTALAVLGDTETALANYEVLVTPRLNKSTGISGEEVLYLAGEGALSEKDCTAAASMLATVLGHKDAEPLILYLIQKPSLYEPYIAQQLLFLERFDPKTTTSTQVSYLLDGTVQTKELDRHGLSLSMSKAQLAVADFKVLSGEVYADLYYTAGGEEGADSSKKKLGITKTITPMEGDFAPGKLVKVTLTPDLSGLDTQVGNTELLVEDYLPTGMRFERYGAVNRQNPQSSWWMQSQDGQRLRFGASAQKGLLPLVYYARCATPGDYVVESPYISSGELWGTTSRGSVTIQ